MSIMIEMSQIRSNIERLTLKDFNFQDQIDKNVISVSRFFNNVTQKNSVISIFLLSLRKSFNRFTLCSGTDELLSPQNLIKNKKIEMSSSIRKILRRKKTSSFFVKLSKLSYINHTFKSVKAISELITV